MGRIHAVCTRRRRVDRARTRRSGLAREQAQLASVREYPTLEIRTDLALNEPSDRCALPSRTSEEWLDLLADDFVQKGLLGLVAFVLDGGKESIGITRWSALYVKASDVPRRQRGEASGGMGQSPALFRFTPHLSSGIQAEPPGSRFRRNRTDSSLLTGSRTGLPYEMETTPLAIANRVAVFLEHETRFELVFPSRSATSHTR
jgi:hypothetical protein